ncbi:MAG: hypothetical protein H7224_07805 [Polaromonas sp.]|nr:hypothetical protein [Polaromonas sp.]
MNPNLNRRELLLALVGLGATIAFTSALSQTNDLQIDSAWDALTKDPWYFEVNDHGTIVESGNDEPEINSDVYESISVAYLKTPQDVVDEVDSYEELRSHFAHLASDELEQVESDLDDDDLAKPQRKALLKLRAALQDEDEGWRDWVLLDGKKGVPRFRDAIEEWLGEPVNWMATDFWPQGWSSQGRALSFFRNMDFRITGALGVKITEGEHPGSSYYAAELRSDITAANAAAVELGLPFRFREEKV